MQHLWVHHFGPVPRHRCHKGGYKGWADAVIAVGGDGTLHEVVNGFFWKGSPIRALDRGPDHSMALGICSVVKHLVSLSQLIPLGTGSDFARTFGWTNDPREAIDRIVREFNQLVEAMANGDMFVQSDGEHFGFLPTKFSVLPGAVDFFC